MGVVKLLKKAQRDGVIKRVDQKPPKETPVSLYDSRRVRRKGRYATIMTGVTGAEDKELTLGKKTLLG
tara:strand:- start:86 stop:289 length:204 start_codon:yes stop_codon:yes gene_type:complete